MLSDVDNKFQNTLLSVCHFFFSNGCGNVRNPYLSIKTFTWLFCSDAAESEACMRQKLLHFHICSHIKPWIYNCLLNVKHNAPYGVFICFLVQLLQQQIKVNV